MKFNIWRFFDNLSIQFKFRYNLTRITGTLHEDFYVYYDNISLTPSLNEKYFEQKLHRTSTHTLHVQYIFFSTTAPLWDNMEKYCRPDRPRVTIWCCAEMIRFACRITKARIQTHTHTHTHHTHTHKHTHTRTHTTQPTHTTHTHTPHTHTHHTHTHIICNTYWF